MVVRRNDRRRRLMNDEFVPTIELGSPTPRADQRGVDGTSVAKRRTYASGADRRNQLRTSDLFPKRTWLIVAFGFLLFALIAVVNGLARHAVSWQPVIGPEGVAALQLGGTGTLASWFTCFLMLSVAMASLQIYAMRRHRCDDYVGTYRMWMWFPPIFAIASLASIVDIGAITRNVFDATLGMSLPPGSLLPLISVLVVLSLLAGRVLYEVKESRAAVAMVVLAWLSLAVSVAMQTEWAGSQIVASDRQIVLGNSYLVSAVALLVGHLFYARFVYLHAHGLIVGKQDTVTKAKAKANAKTVGSDQREAGSTGKVGGNARSGKKSAKAPVKRTQVSTPAQPAKTTMTEAEKKRALPKQAAAKASAPKAATVKMQKPASHSAGDSAKTVDSPAAAEVKPAKMNSFKSLMDKRNSDKQAAGKVESVGESDPPTTLKMSKAERKRAKKAKRAQRKAA